MSAPSALAIGSVGDGTAPSEVPNAGGDLLAVEAVDAVDLLDDLAVDLHEARIQRVILVMGLEILHRQSDVQVVGARRDDILPGRRRLGGDGWIHVRVEERRVEAREELIERLTVLER